MEKLQSVIVKRVIEFDYTDAVNDMILEGLIENDQDIKDNVKEWFAEDAPSCLEYNLHVSIKQ